MGDQSETDYKAIYIVTDQDGHWGIIFRSSYAP